jgi:metal-responsive CopG/Arc/MetJ family transcriptional regulator
MMSTSNQRIILSMPLNYVHKLDELVRFGVAPSRNALVEKIVGGFLSDLKDQRKSDNSAMGSLVGFILFMVGVGIIASIFKGE